MAKRNWAGCLALVVALLFGSSGHATSIVGDLYSQGDTDGDSSYDYWMSVTVSNQSGTCSIEEVIFYFATLDVFELDLGAAPAGWDGVDVSDPVPDGFGGLMIAGSVDTWTEPPDYQPIEPLGVSSFFDVFFEVDVVDWFDPAALLGEVWYDCGANEYVDLDLTFHPYDHEIIPEPATLTLLTLGVAGLAVGTRRRRP